MSTNDKVRIFFPVDVPTLIQGGELLAEVGPYVDVAKVGLELMENVGLPAAINLPKVFGLDVFADTKLYDIPNTVRGAAMGITSHGVAYFNLMAEGGKAMMEAAMEGADKRAREWSISRPKVIAVTIPTSQNFDDLVSKGIIPPEIIKPKTDKEKQTFITSIVMKLAETAVAAGVDCVLSSPLEVAEIRKRWPDIEIFSPGIRAPDSPLDDQSRKMTPYEAVKTGVTGLVIGRLIRTPPKGMTREDMAKKVREQIQAALAEMS